MRKTFCLLLCLASFVAYAGYPLWDGLAQRCEQYRERTLWDGNQWEKDVALLKDFALKGKIEAYHELFSLTTWTDGYYTDVLGNALADVCDKNEKLYYKLLKKEPKK